MGGGGNPLVSEAMYGGAQKVAGGQFNLGYGGLKSPLAPIVNSAYQGNFSPMKKFGFGGFGGVDNYAAGEINDYRYNHGMRPLDPDDLDDNGEADFLTATKHKIDNYLAKQYLMGRRKLTVSVNYANMPLEYQYLSQFHGFPNPVAGTPLGKKFGLTTQRNTYNNPRSAGAFTPAMQPPKPYMQQMAQMASPQVAATVPVVPVNNGIPLVLDETTEPEAEPEVAGAATNQTAAENQDRQANMAGSISNVPGMGQTAYRPGQTAGPMGQMTGQMPGQTAGQMGQTGYMPGQMTGQMGQTTGQMGQMPGQTTGQMSGQPGQMGQMSGQMLGQMPGQTGHMGQMGQSGQMGGPMGNMLRLLGQGGHQNQFIG